MRKRPLCVTVCILCFGIAAQDLFAAEPLVSEARVGILKHDVQFLAYGVEEGWDLNLELLFRSPEFLEAVGSPRPHVGMNINNKGLTNQFYLGATWDVRFDSRLFTEFHLGGTYHDGKTNPEASEVDRKRLGCSTLFRLGVDFGYDISDRHGLLLHLSHISSGRLCTYNSGMNELGLRYSYRF